ncbi:unnamed protein product, partial [Phaeothamnion confervicola]
MSPTQQPPAAPLPLRVPSQQQPQQQQQVLSSQPGAGVGGTEQGPEVRCGRCGSALGSALPPVGDCSSYRVESNNCAAATGDELSNSGGDGCCDGSASGGSGGGEDGLASVSLMLFRHRILGRRSSMEDDDADAPMAEREEEEHTSDSGAAEQQHSSNGKSGVCDGGRSSSRGGGEEICYDGGDLSVFRDFSARRWLLGEVLHAAESRSCYRTVVVARDGAGAGISGRGTTTTSSSSSVVRFAGGGGFRAGTLRLRLINAHCRVSDDPNALPIPAAKVAFSVEKCGEEAVGGGGGGGSDGAGGGTGVVVN